MNLKYLIIVSIFLTFLNSNSFAEKTHGISMHGKPKYESNFKNLDYVTKLALVVNRQPGFPGHLL